MEKMNFNSAVNQEIKGEFVGKHVYVCCSDIVPFILNSEESNKPFDIDDVVNQYVYPAYGGFLGGSSDDKDYYLKDLDDKITDLDILKDEKITIVNNLSVDLDDLKEEEGKEKEVEELEKELEKAEKEVEELEKEIEELEEEADEIKHLEEDYQEVLEWYYVSDFLARKLIEKNEVVIEGQNIWGRTCSGQAILLDDVISSICYDRQILEGQ